MIAGGEHRRSIWCDADRAAVHVIDQHALPFELRIATLRSLDDAADAIASMLVRGAPLIGATAAYGLALAAQLDPSDAALDAAAARLVATRPTAVNLRWAVDRVMAVLRETAIAARAERAFDAADAICDQDVAINRRIGEHGLNLMRGIAARNGGRPVQVMTHCNAGWLATVDWGTATAPIYLACREGIPVHVWVSETRPRNQGALTAWELAEEQVPHTLIADNAAGQLLRSGRVDLLLTGTDRVARNGDVANKVGTYLKALAARDAGVPFYVAAPSPSIDWGATDGDAIPIEERDPAELTHIRGVTAAGSAAMVRIAPETSHALNIGFDVTPARLVTGLITERGIASPETLAQLFMEIANA